MSLIRLPDGSVAQDCFSGNAATASDSSGNVPPSGATRIASGAADADGLLGDVSTPFPWGAARSKTEPRNRVILELYSTTNGPVVWLYKPDHSPALFDELSQQLASLENPSRWVLPALGDETTETFERFIKPLTDAFLRKTDEEHIANDDPAQLDAAEELARGVLLWRYGMPENVSQADTARAKGLWGELTMLSQLEDPAGGGLENASSCWKAFGAKWDIEKIGVVEPLEVKTTQRNTHTHELRHSQLLEGAACRVRLVSIRCSQADVEAPTLEDLLLARRQRAELLGEEGAVCVARVNLELERLTRAEKGLRLRQEGTTVVVPVSKLPAFPAFPAEYRDLKYTVDFAATNLATTSLWCNPASTSVDALGLSARPANCLQQSGVHTIGDLLKLGDAELLALPHFGAASLAEVRNKLAAWTAATDGGQSADGLLASHPMLGYAPEALLQEAGRTNVERHIQALCWAQEHNKQNFSWSDLQNAAQLLMGEDGRMIRAAAGIYKAAGTPWVRGVRYTPDSGYNDEALEDGYWYALERLAGTSKSKDASERPPPSRYQVELVWVTQFDLQGRRCLLTPQPLDSLPAVDAAMGPLTKDKYANKALWLNYIYQIPLIYARGF